MKRMVGRSRSAVALAVACVLAAGCTSTHGEPASISTSHQPPGGALCRDTTVTRLDAHRDAESSDRFTIPDAVTVRNPVRVLAFIRVVCGLPVMVGSYACPSASTTHYHLDFFTGEESKYRLTLDVGGCQTVSGSGLDGTRIAAGSEVFWSALGRALGVPHAQRDSFAPLASS